MSRFAQRVSPVLVVALTAVWLLLNQSLAPGQVLLGFALSVVLAWFGIWVLSHLLCICGPNEILVISGRRHELADGTSVGYKVLHGGRGLRIPILEEATQP